MKSRRRPTRSLVLKISAALLLLAFQGFWYGCSPQQRYRTLSFFFDGVPNPDAASGRAGPGAAAAAFTVTTHKPFADGNCDACHPGGTGSYLYRSVELSISSTVCLKCHQEVTHQYPVMHGPVSAVECLFCHVAHEAAQPHLLRMPAPDVCLQCHTRELLPEQPPEHLLSDSDCLRCHVGHGAQQHGMLRAGAPAMTPTTQPAATVPSRGAT